MTTTQAIKERPILFSAPMVRAILNGTKTQTRRVVKPQPAACSPWLPPQDVCIADRNGDAMVASGEGHPKSAEYLRPMTCPLGKPGERLYVREAFWIEHDWDAPEMAPAIDCGTNLKEDTWARVAYCATHETDSEGRPVEWFEPDEINDERYALPWGCAGITPHFYSKHPSIHMPRWASRITLEITDVHVERLQEISHDDAELEGISMHDYITLDGEVKQFYACGDLSGSSPRSVFADLWDSLNAKKHPWSSNPWVWVVEFKRIGGAG